MGAFDPPPPILADQLTLFQPEGADYASHSTTCPPWIFRPSAGSAESMNKNLLIELGIIRRSNHVQKKLVLKS